MNLEFSPEEIKEIVQVSFHYYYNASKWPAELSKYYHEFRNYTMLSSFDNNSYEHIF